MKFEILGIDFGGDFIFGELECLKIWWVHKVRMFEEELCDVINGWILIHAPAWIRLIRRITWVCHDSTFQVLDGK